MPTESERIYLGFTYSDHCDDSKHRSSLSNYVQEIMKNLGTCPILK